ncbi:MAG: hypothetical protein ABIF71_02430 [Planctomycetota bacterium]
MVTRLTPDNISLLAGMQVSHQLRARVGALLQKGISLTIALAETAAPGTALEKFLLLPDLMRQAEGLDAAGFAALLAGQPEEVRELAAFMVAPDGVRVLLLADEAIAGDIMERSGPPAAGLPVERTATGALAASRQATRAEQMQDDPDSLRMTILTSPDTQAKVEAIRRALFSDLDIITRGNLFFAALADEDNTVRTEALRAMIKIGLDTDLADAMMAFCTAAPAAMPGAIKRLEGILTRVAAAESVIGARILVSRLQDNVSTATKHGVLWTLAGIVDRLAADREAVRTIAGVVLRVFVREPDDLAVGTQAFFEKVLPLGDPALYAFLHEELFKVADVRVSAMLAALIMPYTTEAAERERILTTILAGFNDVAATEAGRRRVLASLGRIEDPGVYAGLVRMFDGFKPDVRVAVMYFMGTALRRKLLPVPIQEALVDALLDVMRRTDSKQIIALLEAGILPLAEVGWDRKERIARELVRLWTVFTIPYLQFAIEDTLAGLGAPAVKVMFRHVADFPADPVTAKISPILAAGAAALDKEAGPEAREVFHTCIREGVKLFISTEYPAKGVLAEILGRACLSPLMPKGRIQEIHDLFTGAPDYARFRTKILEGLGWLGSSPKVDLETKVDLAARFKRFLSIKLPEVKGRKMIEDNTNVFVMGAEADIYTDFLPVIVNALGRIGASVPAGTPLQESILDSVLVLWNKAASWEVILGPAATTALVRCLGGLGAQKGLSVPVKRKILGNLVRWKNQMAVLAEITAMAAVGDEKQALAPLYAEVVEEALEMLRTENDAYSEKDKQTILGCVAAIINHRRLKPAEPEFKRTIDTAIQFLARGYKEGVRQAYGWLQDLARNPDVPQEYRDGVTDTLKSMQKMALELYGG